MCGIAGVIHRDGSSDVGSEMTSMLQSMKHRGPGLDAATRSSDRTTDLIVIRFKLADANDPRDFDFKERLERHRMEVETRLSKIGAVDRPGGARDGVRVPGDRSRTTAISKRSPTTSRTCRGARCSRSVTRSRS